MSGTEIVPNGTPKLKLLLSAPAADELSTIADRIRNRLRRTTEDINDTGRDLIAAHEKLKGRFIAWVEAEFGMTARTAQLYVQAARFAAERYEIISHLPPTTLYKLSAPSTPDEIKTAVVADLEAGRAVDHRAVEAEIIDRRRMARQLAQCARPRPRRRSKAASPAAAPKSILPDSVAAEAIVEIVSLTEEQAADNYKSIILKLPPDDLKRLLMLACKFTLIIGPDESSRPKYAAIAGALPG